MKVLRNQTNTTRMVLRNQTNTTRMVRRNQTNTTRRRTFMVRRYQLAAIRMVRLFAKSW